MADATRSDLFAAGLVLVGGVWTGKILVDQVLLAKSSPGAGKTEMMSARSSAAGMADDLVAVGAFVFGTYMTLSQLPALIAEFRRIAP